MSGKAVADLTFEEAMSALEDVVRQLESGEVDLEKSIALYERGAELKAHCEAKLKKAEEKVELITRNDRGEPTGTQPLDPD
jgi:exodeoxyribonuclease VII small subunit